VNVNPLALASAPTEDRPASETRRAYEAVIDRAMIYAERWLPRDQAFEVSHDVAIEMLGRAEESVLPALIYIAVTNRMRKLWRSADRRAALEGSYIDMRAGVVPAWAEPGADLEARELRDHLVATIAGMPAGMRDAFLLVRDQGLSYKEAAARLQVGVGTVHTQISRANVILRESLRRYRTGDAEPLPPSRRPLGL
jgi:DNA-directed RNA polymerase specialized sigma24 family protein